MRTIIALILVQVDPKNCNFNIDEKVFRYIKDCLVKGKLYMGADEIFMWMDIQKHIPDNCDSEIQGSKGFFKWFKEFDLAIYKINKLQYCLWIISYLARTGSVKTIIKAKKIKNLFFFIILRLWPTVLTHTHKADRPKDLDSIKRGWKK